jgi:hypothetical protein
MIVLKAEQVARMQRRKDEEREAKKRMLVSDIIFLFGLKDLRETSESPHRTHTLFEILPLNFKNS